VQRHNGTTAQRHNGTTAQRRKKEISIISILILTKIRTIEYEGTNQETSFNYLIFNSRCNRGLPLLEIYWLPVRYMSHKISLVLKYSLGARIRVPVREHC
jgi:hypothetical protein